MARRSSPYDYNIIFGGDRGDGRRSRPAGRIPLRFICPNNPFLPPPPPPRSLHAYNKMLRGPSFLPSFFPSSSILLLSPTDTIIISDIHTSASTAHLPISVYIAVVVVYASVLFFFPDIFLDRLDRHIIIRYDPYRTQYYY